MKTSVELGRDVPERGQSSSRVLEARKHSAHPRNTRGFWLELEKKCEMVCGEVRAVVRGQTVPDRKQRRWTHLESGGRRQIEASERQMQVSTSE